MRDAQLSRLARLNELRSAGALTDVEFEEQKKTILTTSRFAPNMLGYLALLFGVVTLIAVVALFATRQDPPAIQNLANAPKISPKATAPVTIPNTAPVAPPLPNWVGNYVGTVEGAKGSMSIKSRSNGTVFVELGVGSPRCSGGINFTAKPEENLIRHDFPYDSVSQLQCTMTLVRNSTKIIVQERECSPYHGFECSFNGTFRRGNR